jgi:predicted TIM-barrel fold metal-dependent hydrolase
MARTRKIIDAHTHVFPDKIAEKVSENIGAFYGLDWYSPASAERLIQAGGEVGVCHYLVCSTATSVGQVEHINDFISRLAGEHSEFTALMALHPDFENYEEELDRGIQMGLRGVKLHPDFQRFNIDEERLFPMYRAIARRGLPVLIHMGDERYEYSRPCRLAQLMRAVPDLTVIAAHFGGYQRWEEALDLLPPSPNLWFDTSSSLGILSYGNAMRLIERFGVNKFMFGTDFPIWNPSLEIKKVEKLPLSENEFDLVFSENFKRLFNVPNV